MLLYGAFRLGQGTLEEGIETVGKKAKNIKRKVIPVSTKDSVIAYTDAELARFEEEERIKRQNEIADELNKG